jgi:hypothetical protein
MRGALGPPIGHGEPRHATEAGLEEMELHEGSDLAIEDVALRSLTVSVEPRLSGQIAVLARFGDPEEYARLAFRTRRGTLLVRPRTEDGGGPGWLGRLLGRRKPPDEAEARRALAGLALDALPTLDLEIRVPSYCGLRLHLPGSPVVRAGDLCGDLDLDVLAASDVRIGTMAAARVVASGSARVDIAGTEGALGLTLSRNARVDVGTAASGDAAIALSGHARCTVAAGEVADLTLDVRGGTVAFGGLVTGNLGLDASGSVRVEVARVLGEVEARWSGGAEVSVGRWDRAGSSEKDAGDDAEVADAGGELALTEA